MWSYVKQPVTSSQKIQFVWNEIRDYLVITVGIFSYALGWVLFFIPYKITIGGVAGIGAITFYATGIPMQVTYFAINLALMIVALKYLGMRFVIRTSYGILMMHNGSTGGTDIIAAAINKYRDISLGRMILYCDILIIASCYFVFNDWRRVLFGYVATFIYTFTLDSVTNRNQHAGVMRTTIGLSFQTFNEFLVVSGIAFGFARKASGQNTGGAAQGVDANAGVVGNGRQPCGSSCVASLGQTVF